LIGLIDGAAEAVFEDDPVALGVETSAQNPEEDSTITIAAQAIVLIHVIR
jgi:hypothetical protein